MDYPRDNGFSGGNVVQVLSGNTINENQAGLTDSAIWATEDEYGMWNAESVNEPPNKRSKTPQSADSTPSNRSKAIGKMFYKTKLCCKFRAGTCPYITNCNFAHSIEELRKPPPNWQEIVSAHGGEEEERGPREQFQIPILGVSDEAQRSYKGRHCKKFYTEEGCPYGESCTFMHDEQSRARESVVISLGPSGYGGNNSGSGSAVLKGSNWKTRICNKWEMTGYCPFGSKCHFAHGSAELNNYSGGQIESEVKDVSTQDAKQGALPAKTWVDGVVHHSDGYHTSQRLSNAVQKDGRRSSQKWKGPDKISKIYGDWIDDLE
ncbi:hypothetical protein CASFOL_033527 [Castilleja foliolosa]|uniref:C3H1-type domain-containing protein n=1 Tax=Castilleja foliolosa TaxID=1961234 RepID=A0ABD3BX94_9LAMI